MAKIKIWHNPRCSKSRQGLEHLKDKGCDIETFEYMKNEINAAELAALIKKSGQPLSDFIRTNEAEYKRLGLKDSELTPEKFADIAANHPKLLQRPIIINGDRVVLARPTSKINEIL